MIQCKYMKSLLFALQLHVNKGVAGGGVSRRSRNLKKFLVLVGLESQKKALTCNYLNKFVKAKPP